MSKEAEKLAAALDSRVVRNWVHSTGTSPEATGFKHDAECQQAAALLRRQAEQIRELREALKRAEDALTVTLAPCGEWPAAIKSTQREALKNIRAALSNTKEET